MNPFLTNLLPRFLAALLLLATATACPAGTANPSADTKLLTVVMDDNYPPYSFRDDSGKLQGYLVDAWALWEQKTGVRVNLMAMPWVEARQSMAKGQADVIDTVFRTPEREQVLDFSPPYAKIPVSVYAHAGIGGITSPAMLRGFQVGVKAGDACADRLRDAGIDTQQAYPDYAGLVREAIAGQIKIFCLDEPPANYLLYRARAERDFRQAFTLYTGEFHRAVHKGDARTLQLVQHGFDAITPAEQQALHEKWMGKPLDGFPLSRHAGYGLLAALAAGGALFLWVVSLRRAVRQRTQELENERAHLKTLIATIPDLIWLKDQDGIYLGCNAQFETFFGATEAEIVGKTDYDFVPGELADSFREHDRKAMEAGRPSTNEEWLTFAGNGYHGLFETIKTPMRDAAGGLIGVLGIARDITARHTAETRIQRMTSLYAALSECNQAIVRMARKEELFPAVCRDAVEFGGMKMAWIGLVDPASRMVKSAACFGAGAEYLQDLRISVDAESPYGQGPTGTAIREGKSYWCQDFQHDPATAPWHERGRQFGWNASASVPIYCGGQAIGAFSFYAGEINAFDEPARNLLEEMAMDIGYALDRFEIERTRARLQAELAAAHSRMENILSSISQAVWSADAVTHQVLYLSPAAEKIYGRPVSDFFSDPMLWLNMVHPEDAAIAGAMNAQLFAQGSAQAEFRIVRPDGEIRWIHDEARLARDEAGNPLRLDGVVSDIHDRKQSESQLQLSAQVFEQSAEGIIITDSDNRIVSVNRAFCEITGIQAGEALGQDPGFISSGRHDKDFYRAMWQQIEQTGHWQGEIWNRRGNGEIFPEWLSVSAVHGQAGKITHYIGIFNDISRHKQAEEHIRHLAHYDALTSLPNRTLLNDRIGHAIILAQRGRHPMALMFLDLDRFKNINDSLGHQIGDQMLVEVAMRLKDAIREEDTVSRLGGDEFIVLLPSANADGAAHVAEKIIQSIAQPFQINGHELSITPSIGIAMYPVDGQNAEGLIQCADSAMYRAKQSGRNMFRFFTPEMHLHASRTLQLENAMRRALERQQLSLHYQPQVDIDSGRVVGCEALLRWQHPEFGMVSPAEFIPIAEDSGQILPIGAWVMREAVRQVKAWHQAGLPMVPVAVNLSAAQFRQVNLPQLVAQILQEADIPPSFLELELTESITMEDPAVAIGMMNRLHQCGIKLSIDDFGTGYSSLSYLKRFNIQKLKIDQSFVRDIVTDPEDAAIVSAIISLASSLNVSTIAEGVETRQQLQFLREKGCREAQGFYFSRPLPAREFEAFLRAGQHQ